MYRGTGIKNVSSPSSPDTKWQKRGEMSKTAITWPIAKDKSDHLVEIRDAKAGDKYFCPECGSPFIPRLGDIRVHHFAHYPGYVGACTGESGCHYRAKWLLAYYFEINPQVVFLWKCRWCDEPFSCIEEVEHVDVEKGATDERKPDVMVLLRSGRQLYGEVVFKHPPDMEKIKNYKEQNISLLVWRIDSSVEEVPKIEFVPWHRVENQLDLIRVASGCHVYFNERVFPTYHEHRPTPSELGFPKKFKEWRPDQYETIEAIARSEKPVYLLEAATGIGKSVIGIGVHRFTKKKCIYVVRTIQLQSQLEEDLDFPDFIKVIKGRRNYRCLKYLEGLGFSAEDCTDRVSPCEFKRACPYLLARDEAVASPVALLNLDYYLAEANGLGRFGKVDFLVLDEIDTVENELLKYIQFRVTEKQLGRFDLFPPNNPTDKGVWLNWAEDLASITFNRIRSLEMDLARTSKEAKEYKAETLRELKQFDRSREVFLDAFDDSWVFIVSGSEIEGNREWMFKPVFASRYTYRYLWSHAEQVLGMSATILDPYLMKDVLGIDEHDYKVLPSPFPKDIRPIIYRPIANLTEGTMDTECPKLLKAVQDIIDRYSNIKILVHTVSYSLRDYLLENLKSDRLITHEPYNREEQLDIFKELQEPLVMLSPSFDRGVDLVENECRCIIICKIPYLNLGDIQIRKRREAPGGQKWYLWKAAQTLVQMSGRAVRSSNDYCVTYIFDRQFGVLYYKAKYFWPKDIFPEWWLDAVECRSLV